LADSVQLPCRPKVEKVFAPTHVDDYKPGRCHVNVAFRPGSLMLRRLGDDQLCRRLLRAALAPCLPRALRVLFGKCATVRFLLAAATALLMF